MDDNVIVVQFDEPSKAYQALSELNRMGSELGSFVTSEENNPPRFFSIAFEHGLLVWLMNACAAITTATPRAL